ncbi:uncharacterized protein LOC143030081 [Oratosquilla oratoria]|uniref:uncharacterized protein LOC143030081 n=1 Tax=Oratosquilla oratoria TaxID=337810 RepID=UPI003F7681AE
MADVEQFLTAPTFTALQKLKKTKLTAVARRLGLEGYSSLSVHSLKQRIHDHLVENEYYDEQESDPPFQGAGETQSLLELKLEIKKLELQVETIKQGPGQAQTNNTPTFNINHFLGSVPKFDADEPDRFFACFERTAKMNEWPYDKWTQLVYRSFTGKALDVFSALSDEQVKDYELVKTTVLTSYQLVPEAYRQQFRKRKRESQETYVEFFRRKHTLIHKWIESENAKTPSEIIELILLEDIRTNIHPDLRAHLDQRGIRTLAEAGPVADHFCLTNPKVHFRPTPSDQRPPPSQPRASPLLPMSTPQAAGPRMTTGFPSSTSGKPVARETGGSSVNSERKSFCKYCKRSGHEVSDCYKLINKKPSLVGTPSLSINVAEQTEVQLDLLSPTNNRPVATANSSPTSSPFEPYCSSGSVALTQFSEPIPLKILRDTGSALSLVAKDAVPSIETCYTGNWVLVNGLTGGSRFPLCMLYLRSPITSGYVTLGVVDRLPVKGVSLLIGNDLAGGVMLPNAVVSSRPSVENNTRQLEQEIPGLFPACAVTRSMSQREGAESSELVSGRLDDVDPSLPCEESEVDSSQVDLPEIGLGEFFEDPSPAEKTKSSSDDDSVMALASFSSSPVTRSKLIQLQVEDPELASFRSRAVSESEAEREASCYYTSSGVLLRKFRSPVSPANHPWTVHHQIVVPRPLRQDILSIAHDGVGGHLGVRKTYAKILSHFYWPKLKRDVSTYCRTCRPCQVAGKPNPTVKPYPLQPIPVVKEPFRRIVIDCVGPLPKTPRGFQFLFTIVDCATRYPEAIPLRRITAKNVVRALIHFVTQVGLPTVVQSDQGSNFTSRLFNQVMESLGVRQSRSSAYHPQSQGVVERFHQTLKRVLRTFCIETGRDWDEGVDLLLFAIRDSVQESLGYSPFQLIYGHEVRGPLKVLKESWISNEAETPLASYVPKFREKLQLALSLAHSNLDCAQTKMKQQFDRSHRAEDRYFAVGDQVLSLLPLNNLPLQSKYSGPYVVLERQGQANYVIHTPDRRKKRRLVHVNLLKPFHDRDEAECNRAEPVCMVVPEESEASDECFSWRTFNPFSRNSRASCSTLEHDVDTEGALPIRQRPYRLNAFKREYLRAEVQRLQELGIVEPSHSPWASPVVLVPKPDGSMRLCVDYRRVNAVTKADGYPLPRIDDVIDDVGAARWVTKLDLLQGYYQVRLTERSRAISAFVTPEGLYQFTVLPFGLRNAPSTFQRLMNFITTGLEGVRCYLDDIVVFGDTWEEHLDRLKTLFAVLAANSLTVNLAKSEFGHAQITFLGHVVGRNEVRPVAAKIAAIQQYPVPADKKAVMRLLGLAGYYRRFCPNFSTVVAPMTDLLGGKKVFKWTPECQQAFESLKTLMSGAPVLRAPDLQAPFILHTDASDVAGGAVLLQEGEEGVVQPVAYYSKKFNKHQRNYATVEKEALSLLMALEHFRVYLGSTLHPIQVLTDHNPLTFVCELHFVPEDREVDIVLRREDKDYIYSQGVLPSQLWVSLSHS